MFLPVSSGVQAVVSRQARVSNRINKKIKLCSPCFPQAVICITDVTKIAHGKQGEHSLLFQLMLFNTRAWRGTAACTPLLTGRNSRLDSSIFFVCCRKVCRLLHSWIRYCLLANFSIYKSFLLGSTSMQQQSRIVLQCKVTATLIGLFCTFFQHKLKVVNHIGDDTHSLRTLKLFLAKFFWFNSTYLFLSLIFEFWCIWPMSLFLSNKSEKEKVVFIKNQNKQTMI